MSLDKYKAVPPTDMLTFTGTVMRILYESPKSSWTIALVKPEQQYAQVMRDSKPTPPPSRFREDPSSVKCVGVLASSKIGVGLTVTGYWKIDPKFGLQFAVDSSRLPANLISQETSREAFSRLFSTFRGIGPATAGKIYDAFKHDLSLVDADIKGGGVKIRELVGEESFNAITEGWEELSKKAGVLAFLYDMDLGPGIADRTIAFYTGVKQWSHERMQEEIARNPYMLIDDISGVGFEKADKAALKIGVAADSPFRKAAALEHVLNMSASDGSTFVEETVAYMSVLKLIGQEMVKLYRREDDMIGEGAGVASSAQLTLIRIVVPPLDEEIRTHERFRIVRVKGKPLPFYALARYVNSENGIAQKLAKMLMESMTNPKIKV